MLEYKSKENCLGIIAGEGNLPHQLINYLYAKNKLCCIVGIKGFFNPVAIKNKVPYLMLSLGSIEKGLLFLKNNEVKNLILCGRIRRPNIKDISVDAIAAKWIIRIMPYFFQDDSVLRAIIKEFEKEGFKVLNLLDVLSSADIISKGSITSHCPSKKSLENINKGLKILHSLGQYDIGQSIIIQEESILGIESIEGTNGLINRIKTYVDVERFEAILIKSSKNNQTFKADLPVVGPDTVDNCIRVGLKGIALESGRVVIIDRTKMISLAESKNFFIIGI